MIDAIHSLAFSIQANRGVYAVLLGSGVSRVAKVPTGWEITLDLVRKLAEVSGEPCEPSPEQWYRKKFRRDPDYSALLDAVAKTPAERQQLLRGYWEASEQEREEGAKQPTAAHRAIASLAVQGFVKVIVTTNFDRLMETALADVGIAPTILSTPDQVHGALPLIHARCCLFKVHGDYLDTRICNTPQELSAYPPEFDALLDRIFDEFGLIVCGWSADWDEALRNALFRAPSRRFATYWTVRGEPSQVAQQLIAHRGAQVIPVQDADSFFKSLQQHVQSLEEFSRAHPLSTAAAVATLKRYLSESRFRIQLADLIDGEIERVLATTTAEKFPVRGGANPDAASVTHRVRAYEAACETLLEMAVVGGYWAEEEHYSVWQRALERLASVTSESGFTFWMELRRYPATLLLYALGLGATEGSRLSLLGRLLSAHVHSETREDVTIVQVLPPSCLFGQGGEVARILEGMDKRFAPLNDWMHNALQSHAKRVIPNDARYTLVFDELEVLIGLSYAHQVGEGWLPPGAYGYRRQNRTRVLEEIQGSIVKLAERSPFVESRIFGDSVTTCSAALTRFNEFATKLSQRWH